MTLEWMIADSSGACARAALAFPAPCLYNVPNSQRRYPKKEDNDVRRSLREYHSFKGRQC